MTSSAHASPLLFVSHGAPTVAITEDDYTRALGDFGAALRPPRVVAVMSAHWEARGPFRVTSSPMPEQIYDFSGFPQRLYRVSWRPEGLPEAAESVRGALSEAGIPCELDPARGIDHGAWVPLRLLFPRPSVPVVQISLPVPRSPELLLAAGRALAPLRQAGVFLVGSGGIVHNLRRLRWEGATEVEPWAEAFDARVWDALRAGDVAAVVRYREKGPGAELSLPTTEHFDPLFFTLGSVLPSDRLHPIYDGFRFGSLSMRTLAYLPPAP